MRVLVMGVGSVLMTDESVGVRAIEELSRRFRFSDDVELLDGGTSGIELLTYIRDRDHLIIIDAIKADYPPGTVLRVDGEDVPAQFRTRISPHQLGISDLLAAATLTGELPRRLVLFGIEPARVELGLGLSEEVRGGFNKLINVVVDELRNIGCMVDEVEAEGAVSHKSQWDAL